MLKTFDEIKARIELVHSTHADKTRPFKFEIFNGDGKRTSYEMIEIEDVKVLNDGRMWIGNIVIAQDTPLYDMQFEISTY